MKGVNLGVIGVTLGIAVLGAIWAYRDARSRDANPFLWAAAIVLAGLTIPPFGPIIALVFYVFLRPKGELKKCPHCGRSYLNILAFCPHCGKPVKKECLRCHETMELDAVECPHCRMKAV